MKAAMDMWRKKYSFALMIFVVGSALAWKTSASLESYTVFASFLLAIFGTQDLVDNHIKSKNGAAK